MSEEKRICASCVYWKLGIPCGMCKHPDAIFMPTGDTMVFFDAGNDCPLNKKEKLGADIHVHDNLVKYMEIHELESDPFTHRNAVFDRLYTEYKSHGCLIIAYDFDYTVHSYNQEDVSYKRVMKLLQKWRSRGKFICFTASPESRFDYIREYCQKYDLPLDIINDDILKREYTRKVYYNVFLDDRAGLLETVKILEDLLQYIEAEEN